MVGLDVDGRLVARYVNSVGWRGSEVITADGLAHEVKADYRKGRLAKRNRQSC